MRWCASISDTPRRGRSGWMSRSSCRLRKRCCPLRARTRAMIRIGVIGYGYWGPNVARNLRSLPGCEVAVVCDRSPAALQRVAETYPDLAITPDSSEPMLSTKLDAIAVVSPVGTHFELAKAALQNDKHVFVEK